MWVFVLFYIPFASRLMQENELNAINAQLQML